MSLVGEYDGGNIFAKILRGEAPCVKIFENDEVIAFMDIFPQSPGHCLVVPKNVHARNHGLSAGAVGRVVPGRPDADQGRDQGA